MAAPLNDVLQALDQIAPLHYAESWDNVGLLMGHRDREVSRAMLSIDVTPEILDEAVDANVDFLITYHPLPFRPIKRMTDESPEGRLLLTLLNHRIAVYSPHTALDASPGGVTDWLADAIGDGYRRPLVPTESLLPTAEVKVVCFVPHDAVDRVRDSLATTGAGRIGNYDHCSFSTPGTGSFRGGEGSNPTVGEAGHLETVPEVRLEMVCPRSALPLLVTTLQQFHPYEEPAFDIYPLQPVPMHTVGIGRRVVLDQPSTVNAVCDQVKSHLKIDRVKCTDPTKPVRVVGLVPGAGADFVEIAVREGECDLFVTGEMKHHEALRAEAMGCSLILTGHTNSERGYLPIYKSRIAEIVEGLDIFISERDRTRLVVI